MPWVKEERARLIVVETVRRIVAAEYDEVWGKPMLAARCRAVQLFEQVSPAMAKAQAVLPLECAKQALKGLRGCLHSDLRVGSPCAAAAQAAARSGRGSARVSIEKSGRWPPSSSRKPFCLGEMTGSTIPWRQLGGGSSADGAVIVRPLSLASINALSASDTAAVSPRGTRASPCAKTRASAAAAGLVEAVRGEILPSACLFLQKGRDGSRTSGQDSCRPRKPKPFS